MEPVPAAAPSFLMHTTGTTGRPNGCMHSTGGHLAYVAGTPPGPRVRRCPGPLRYLPAVRRAGRRRKPPRLRRLVRRPPVISVTSTGIWTASGDRTGAQAGLARAPA